MKQLAVLLVLAACHRQSPIASCEDDLHGVYVTPANTRWMILDNGETLEAYPMFTDSGDSGAPDVVSAPRRLDLSRTSDGLVGTLHRRYMRRADTCDARTQIHVTACSDNALQLVLADPQAPLTLAPCTWPAAQPARVERWQRE